jgi:hypothetical protein
MSFLAFSVFSPDVRAEYRLHRHRNLAWFKRDRSYHLMSQITRIMAWLMLIAMTVVAGTAVAEPYVTHTDLELRVGKDYLCGTYDPHRARTTVQVFADRLFPIRPIGDGVLEVGPYAKGALLDGGHVPQIAGGAGVGYRFDRYEILVNVGLAYATEKIGSSGSSGFKLDKSDV